MKEAAVTPQDVMMWIRETLVERQGQFDVQDLSFIRKTVRVVSPRRDACFDLDAARWPQLNDADCKAALAEDLRSWAKRSLPPADRHD